MMRKRGLMIVITIIDNFASVLPVDLLKSDKIGENGADCRLLGNLMLEKDEILR
jgi:hypothetical protein